MTEFTIERRRALSAARLGRNHTEETKAKMRGRDNRPFPPHCIKCVNRDGSTCASYNKTCFLARETDCFRRSGRRKEHPDYKKKTVKHG